MDRPLASSSSTGFAAAQWTLRLLGPFALIAPSSGERAPLPGKRERVLLAYLALSPNFRASRRKLTSLLWGEGSDETTLENLRVCIWRLRKTLRDTQHRVIASEGEDIVLDIGAIAVDVLAFRRLAAASGTAELEAAANLYAGEFLEAVNLDGEEFESWRRTEGTRCRDLAIDALLRLMSEQSRAGETDRAIEAGLRLLQLDPLHEPAARCLMQLYAGSGRRGAAIQFYRSFADALKTELGAQPEAETRALVAEITAATESSSPAALPAPVVGVKAPPGPPATVDGESPERAPLEPPIRNIGVSFVGRYKWAAVGVAAAILMLATVSYRLGYTLSRPAPPAAIASAASPAVSSISIAVLPFANLSGDPSQEFFSDGITEEIIGALAKIPGLQVVARSSAFQFKTQNRDVQSIAQQLHATYLIEGSVRKADDRVRIAVQLIRADRGTNVWSDEYDRPLTDIFAAQEEIARSVATSLHKPLGLPPGENLLNNRPADTAMYDEFLRAKALWWQQDAASLQQATKILDKVVVRVPNYAPAWSLLADTYLDIPFRRPVLFSGDGEIVQWNSVMGAALQRGGTAARHALELDPRDTLAWRALARIELEQNHYAQAEELNARALAIDPDDPNLLLNKNQLLHDRGYLKQALAMSQRAALLEPNGLRYKIRVGWDLWLNGRYDEALKILEPRKDIFVARIYAEQGRYKEAADVLLNSAVEAERFERITLEAAARLLRNAPAKPTSESLPKLGQLYWVYFFVGVPEHMLDWNEQLQKIGYWASVYPLWGKPYASVRNTQRFKNYVRSLGFVDYWRQHGWPDLCHPVGTDDFVCN